VVGGKPQKKHASGRAHESSRSRKPEGLPMYRSPKATQGRVPGGSMVVLVVQLTSISSTEEDDGELGSRKSWEVWRPVDTP
jgi:ribosomal protein L32E